VELAASAGLVLDDWQAFVLESALRERRVGDELRWSAFEVGLIVSRQNGKGSILEARELAGLFLFGEQLILHSAHEFKTAQEAFRRVLSLVENTDDLRKRVLRVRTSHGEEGIELKSGQRLRFIARSNNSGRGFTGDTVILDEAYELSAASVGALLPTLSARPNPQIWYTSSAGKRTSSQLIAVRDRGRVGADAGLAYFEWSAAPEADPLDPDAWASANPALGIRIDSEFVGLERSALPDLEFRRERLGVWDDESAGADWVIPLESWEACADPDSEIVDPVVFAVDVSLDRSHASIAAAGRRADGMLGVEVVDYRRGTSWLGRRLVELVQRHGALAIGLDPGGPSGSLVPELEAAVDVPVVTFSSRDVAQSCGALYDSVVSGDIRHRAQPELNLAVSTAIKRPLGDAWAWARKGVASEVTTLISATLALRTYSEATSTKPVDVSLSVW
jgi:phage terminase large subunit-like protein